jgi:Meiotically up-regulated gene 113
MMRSVGFVYVYRSGDGNVFKIGRTTDLGKRIKTHATGNPEPLTEFAVIETQYASQCETYLHHRLRSRRSTRSDATEFFEVDPDDLAALVEDARHYADEVLPKLAEVERLASEACDDRVLPASELALDIYRRLLSVREQYDTLGFEKDRLEAELKLLIGATSGIERVANWRVIVSQRFDGELFKQEHPELHGQYLRESRYRRFDLL